MYRLQLTTERNLSATLQPHLRNLVWDPGLVSHPQHGQGEVHLTTVACTKGSTLTLSTVTRPGINRRPSWLLQIHWWRCLRCGDALWMGTLNWKSWDFSRSRRRSLTGVSRPKLRSPGETHKGHKKGLRQGRRGLTVHVETFFFRVLFF